MTLTVRAYLRASTEEQDANRARADLKCAAEEHGLRIATFYVENESGASLKRPVLFQLLSDCHPGDILLVEQVDRLSRLAEADWEKLKDEIRTRRVRVVSLDLPTSWSLAKPINDDDEAENIQARMLDAINNMMLDMLAAIARKDYTDRRRRQAQGIATAKANGEYKGRPEDIKRNKLIGDMLDKGLSYTQIQDATKASRATIAKIAKRGRSPAE